MNSLGGQRIGIITEQPVLGDDGEPVLDEFRQPELIETTVWVDSCLFELQTAAGLSTDSDTVTTTKTETAWCLMPVSASAAVQAKTDGGARVSIGVGDIRQLHYDAGKPFLVQGRAAIEYDDEGRADHVFVLCARTVG